MGRNRREREREGTKRKGMGRGGKREKVSRKQTCCLRLTPQPYYEILDPALDNLQWQRLFYDE